MNFGSSGSLTSYWCNSPVPQQETYRKRSSSERSISVTSGGTALNPLSRGGRSSSLAGWAGMVMKGRIDFAVHSLKDVPTELPEGLALAAVGHRAHPFDVLLTLAGRILDELE